MSNQQLQAQAILRVRELEEGGVSDDYKVFQEKYFDDPVGFSRDCIDWGEQDGLSPYQEQAAQMLDEHRRATVRGPHGLGKTALAAIIVLWFALTRDGQDWKVPTLASAWRQLTKFLWPEIHKWTRFIKWDIVGREPFDERKELLTMSLKLRTGEAFALASDNAALIEGAHADHLLYLFDESKTIPPDTFDAAEGAMSSGEAYFLSISTPGEPQGRFYDIHRQKKGYDDWAVLHVTLEMAIKAGRINPEWAKQRAEQWGEDSAVYITRVLGNFAANDEETVISLVAVEQANELWHTINETGEWGEMEAVGADIGRGGDKTVEADRYDLYIKSLAYSNERDTMQVAGRLTVKLKANKKAHAVIDVVGVGAGVVDRMREIKAVKSRVIAFVAGAKTDLLDSSGELGFTNMRSAAWWNLREMLYNGGVALPPDDMLTGDLTAPRYRYMSGGKIQVESKDDIKKRLKRSTDAGDAVVQAFMKENLRAGSLPANQPEQVSKWVDTDDGGMAGRSKRY